MDDFWLEKLEKVPNPNNDENKCEYKQLLRSQTYLLLNDEQFDG